MDLKSIETRARTYWTDRQQQASQPPTFTLVHRPNLLSDASGECSALMPLRLDIEQDGYRLREAFMWNPKGSLTVNSIAELLAADFDLPKSIVASLIVQSVNEQVQDFEAFLEASIADVSFSRLNALIKLDVVIGSLQLIDQFEWPIECDPLVIDGFAMQMIDEFQLPKEFISAIAFCIHEQIYLVKRALLASGWSIVDSKLCIINSSLDPELASRVSVAWQPPTGNTQAFYTIVQELTSVDLDRLEVAREREVRMRKRRMGKSIRGGGRESWTLTPDPPKLHPTPLSYKGSVHRTRSAYDVEGDDADDSGDNAMLLMHHTGEAGDRGRGRGRGRRRGKRMV